jgi:hypothetical protein
MSDVLRRKLLLLFTYQRRGRAISATASCFGDSGFKFWLGERLS